jgi:uncharacterized membrane protein YfcA
MRHEFFIPLFAMGPYALLDSLCFCLSVFYGYWIVRLETKYALIVSIIAGGTIGILLICEDGYINNNLPPQYFRPIIGLLGGVLGYYWASIKCKSDRMKKHENNAELLDTASSQQNNTKDTNN